MAQRTSYSDKIIGEADREIRILIGDTGNDSSDYLKRLKKTMLKVINNELTSRQKEIIMLYYFKGMDIVSISKMLGVSPQAVSAVMKRARLKIYRYMQYYI